MKGRQLILSLSLLLLGGLCLNTSIQAQANGGGQISVQILGNLDPGGTNILSVTPFNGYTITDLEYLQLRKDEMFDVFEVNASTGQVQFTMAKTGADFGEAQVLAYFQQHLNAMLGERQANDIESGPVAGPVMDEDEAATIANSPVNADGTVKSAE